MGILILTCIVTGADFAISGGYTTALMSSSINHPKDSIEYLIEVNKELIKQKVLPDYSEFRNIGAPMGGFIQFAIRNIARGRYSMDFNIAFMKSSQVQVTTLDWTVSRDFELLKRIYVPIGAGLTFGSAKTSISYAQEIHSSISGFEFAVKDSEAKEQVSASSIGLLFYTGARVKLIGKLHGFAQVGYKISTLMDEWEGSYPTWKWDEDADEGEGDWVETDEKFDIPEKYLPYSNVRFNGIDIKIGIEWMF